MKLIYAGTTTQYMVDVAAIKGNVIQVLGSLPMKEKGFKLIDDEGTEYDYSKFKTLYREVEGGYQYSNDGETWEEPTKEVTVAVDWHDDNNKEGYRPGMVTVTVIDGDTAIDNLRLSESNNWQKTYTDVPVSHVYTITASNIANYKLTVNETTADYELETPKEPTVEEMLAELTNIVLELDERVYALEGGN